MWNIGAANRRQRPLDSWAGSLRGAWRWQWPKALWRFDGCHSSQAGGGVGRAKAGRAGARRTRGHTRRAHHDPDARIGQPLAAILTNSYVAGRFLDAPEPDLEEVRSTVADIREVAERAGEVIGGLHAMLKRDTRRRP